MTHASGLYEGFVHHQRMTPIEHRFAYSLFLMYVDLEELPDLFTHRWFWSSKWFNLAWFRRRDHLGDFQEPLGESVRKLIRDRTGFRPEGPVRLLTHFRYFGFQMNPISLFYCFSLEEQLQFIVAEVNNTPWGEQHCYVLDLRQDRCARGVPSLLRLVTPKEFHVSPFLDMNYDYAWQISEPGEQLSILIENCRSPSAICDFKAALRLQRREITSTSLASALCRYPLMTLRVYLAIYWQAWRLWRKGVSYIPHPTAKRPAQLSPVDNSCASDAIV